MEPGSRIQFVCKSQKTVKPETSELSRPNNELLNNKYTNNNSCSYLRKLNFDSKKQLSVTYIMCSYFSEITVGLFMT